ncbi:intermembrane transport protein PqiB [Piscinibacter gummiphilus]|uniref:MlaD family protein n=1 Tax=Piscinibacter gummiphilus TaxID=946333 RepID=A0ABZ0CQ66_9BURK|nr:MlaD family protein [Piscinibacter gummiphilus]WOB07112.1 MlaD family protein [Piscinibacter gummiphilus]
MSEDTLGSTPPPPPTPPEPPVRPPTPVTRKWHGPSLVWLVPIVALAVGVALLIRAVLSTGPQVTIDFHSASGLRPGKTEVRYKEVVVGRVEAVTLSEKRDHVQVTVRLDRSVSNIAVEDTRFWVVRPRIDTAGVSGIETLFSGAYIGVDAGESTKQKRHFTGLENPPFVLRGEPGRGFVLRTEDLGSLDVGSPILYKRNRVGRVVGYNLDPLIDELSVQIFIEAPYDKLVNSQTRFWNASGVEVSLNSSGLKVDTQTLASVISGGISFERPQGTQGLPPASDGSRFKLFSDRKSALAPPDGPPLRVRMVFDQSVRGLDIDAPVDFLGIEIGVIRAIRLDYDGKRKRFPVEVEAEIYPTRLGAVRDSMRQDGDDDKRRDTTLLQRLVQNGLRAQARTGNLLTGQMYVALDFPGKVQKAELDTSTAIPAIPTVPGTLADVQPQIAEIVAKVNKVPFDEIGRNLNETLAQANQAISQLRPEAQASLAEVRRTLQSVQETLQRADRSLLDPSAPIQRNAEQTLQDLQRAAQSLRVLTDYLQRHPESLLRGKPDDAKIPASPERR